MKAGESQNGKENDMQMLVFYTRGKKTVTNEQEATPNHKLPLTLYSHCQNHGEKQNFTNCLNRL